jgi:hypothetical protein
LNGWPVGTCDIACDILEILLEIPLLGMGLLLPKRGPDRDQNFQAGKVEEEVAPCAL